jgi:hypothetical protein
MASRISIPKGIVQHVGVPVEALRLGREEGQGARLITLLNDGEGQGYAAWLVLPTPAEWQRVVQNGLASGAITF